MTTQRLIANLERTALVLLVALNAAALVLAVGPLGPRTFAQTLAGDALIVSQVALLALWLMLGPGRWLVRIPLALILLGTILGIAADLPLAFSLLIMETCWLTVAGIYCRVIGLKIVRETEPVGSPRKIRWSVKSLIATTAGCAVCVKLAMWFFGWVKGQPVIPAWVVIVPLSFVVAAIAILTLWGALTSGPWLARLFSIGIVYLVVASLILVVTGRELQAEDIRSIVEWVGLYGLINSISLLVVRGCGFRVARFNELGESRGSQTPIVPDHRQLVHVA